MGCNKSKPTPTFRMKSSYRILRFLRRLCRTKSKNRPTLSPDELSVAEVIEIITVVQQIDDVNFNDENRQLSPNSTASYSSAPTSDSGSIYLCDAGIDTDSEFFYSNHQDGVDTPEYSPAKEKCVTGVSLIGSDDSWNPGEEELDIIELLDGIHDCKKNVSPGKNTAMMAGGSHIEASGTVCPRPTTTVSSDVYGRGPLYFWPSENGCLEVGGGEITATDMFSHSPRSGFRKQRRPRQRHRDRVPSEGVTFVLPGGVDNSDTDV